MSRLMFNERKAKKQMNKYEGSSLNRGRLLQRSVGCFRAGTGSRSYIREIKDFLYVLIFSPRCLNHFVCTEKNWKANEDWANAKSKEEKLKVKGTQTMPKKRLQSCICWLCRLFRSGGWFSSISSTLNRSSAMCTFLRRSFLVIHMLHFGWPGSLNMQVTTYQRSGGPPVHQFRWLGPLNNRLVPPTKES